MFGIFIEILLYVIYGPHFGKCCSWCPYTREDSEEKQFEYHRLG
jgi:hypothetical protein